MNSSWRLIFGATVLAGCGAGTIDGPMGTDTPGSGGKPTSSTAGSGGSGSPGAGSGGNAAGTQNSSSGGNSSAGSLSKGGATSSNCSPGVAVTSQITRLTNEEYDATVRDLLGLKTLSAQNNSVPSNLLATDQSGGLTDVGWAAYKTVGEAIATQVMADSTMKAKFISCDPAAANCLHNTAVAFGRKAYRRPLNTDEIAAFDAFIAKGKDITPTGAPAEVAQALLSLFLVSPGFLQREELAETSDNAGHVSLSQFEVASRLSYMLWSSTPDDALSKAADDGQLGTPQQVLAQAQRLLKDSRARDMVSAFHRYYMLMGLNTRWDNTNKSPTTYPAFNRNLVPQLQQETEMFFDSIVFAKGGTFEDLLSSTTAFVSSGTAPLYGLDASKFTTSLTETTLDANRPGFLTRLGFLNAYSGYEGTSPILRGAFITKQVLGVPIGAPPPGAEQTPLPPSSDTLDTNRKRYEALTAGDACKTCHTPFVNPPGFAMEAFNTVGTWQTTEHDTKKPIDTTADVSLDASTKVHVTGPKDLMAAIVTARGAKLQYASKWVSYAYQREENPEDACTVQQLSAKMTAGGYTVQNLITDLTQTLSFRVRVAGQ